MRSRFWKNEAHAIESGAALTPGNKARNSAPLGKINTDPTWNIPDDPDNLELMKRGKAPTRDHPKDPSIHERMELSHEPNPQRFGGTSGVVPRWPEEHSAIDEFRHLGKQYGDTPWGH